MEGDTRREEILRLLSKAQKPVSGTQLAREFAVSRQIIVQDIALLRAVNKNILSTNKGYMLYNPLDSSNRVKRTIAVHHSDEQIRDELYTIVDQGGKILDVVVEHEIYGQITVDLLLKTRGDVDEFVEKIENSSAQPLKALTGGKHFHTVEADTKEELDRIERALEKKGYLALYLHIEEA